MGLFLFAAVALVAATLLVLLRPWQRPSSDPEAGVREVNARIYRDQMAELDRDLANGTLAAADHAQARMELQRRLLDDTAVSDKAPAQARHGPGTTLALALLLPLGAMGLYAVLGQPAALLPEARQPQAQQQAGHEADQQLLQMVAQLAAKLEKNPDPKGFAMLARSYHALGRLPEARAAFERVGDAMLHQDPSLLAAYADVLASLDGGRIDGRPLELVKEALKLDPNHPMAISLAATAAFRRQDFAEARRYWEQLLALMPPESEDAQWVRKTLSELPPAPAGTAVAAAKPGQGAPANASPTATPAPAGGPADGLLGSATVSGTVRLSPALAGKVQPQDTVFVFARPTDGSRMPLAVQRATVGDLPLKFRLDDSLAISPGVKLSNASEVHIEARISRSGTANPGSGDLFGVANGVKTGASAVTVEIDQVRP